jgi:hypothetical protein
MKISLSGLRDGCSTRTEGDARLPGSQKNKHHFTVIQEPLPGTRSVLTADNRGAIFFAGSEVVPDLVCGKCERILVSGRRSEQIGDWVLKCSYCGAFNDTALPSTPAAKFR